MEFDKSGFCDMVTVRMYQFNRPDREEETVVMIGVISLLLVMYMLLFFTRIATIILVYTGISEDVARFQSRSAVTGCGFTTGESEQITSHIVRRRVIGNLMLIGNVGIIASISSLLLSMVTVSRNTYGLDLLLRFGILGAGLLLLWYVSKRLWFERAVIRIFEFFTGSTMKLAAFRQNTLCHLPDSYRISELYVTADSPLAGKRYEDALPLLGKVKLLGIRRSVTDYAGEPQAADVIGAGNSLILYGSQPEINDLIQRGEVSLRRGT